MRGDKRIPITITEAQIQTRIFAVSATSDYTESSARTIPYFDLYRSRNSIMETPAQQIQKAAEDEKGHAPQN